MAEQIKKDMLIDTHYERLPPKSWSKAWDLFVQQKTQGKFQSTFCFSWKEALDQGLVYNLVDSPAELGRTMSEFGAEHDSPCSGFAFKGLYTCIREQFTEPGTAICYQQFEWDTDNSMEDFREKVLRGTDPKDHLSHVPSIRHVHELEGVRPRCRTQHWEQLGARLR